jgi:hypothetical protein
MARDFLDNRPQFFDARQPSTVFGTGARAYSDNTIISMISNWHHTYQGLSTLERPAAFARPHGDK